MATFMQSIYTLLLALWVGGISLFTFIVTPEIFRSYGRDAAGEIVGRLFPGYFLFTLLLSVLVLLILPLFRSSFGQSGFRWSLVLAVIAVVINVFVFFKLHPEIRKIKQEIHSFQSAQDDSPLRKTFRTLHAVSMTLNLMLLADGVTLLLIGTSLKR
ncbi:MAG TPA: DUF4149 domain-containing protein [Dissulfurispiraceae bacterium]|nr:DUF4149 domain-containing protein [Dissulfurispiraceae bacterium]